LPLTNI